MENITFYARGPHSCYVCRANATVDFPDPDAAHEYIDGFGIPGSATYREPFAGDWHAATVIEKHGAENVRILSWYGAD